MMNTEKIKEILDKHAAWVNGDGGERANLRWANLSGANLSGADLRGADLSGADTDARFVQVSCIGSRKGVTTYCFDVDVVWCGCFKGTLAEFEAQVEETHKNNPQYLAEYRGAIAYFRALKGGEA